MPPADEVIGEERAFPASAQRSTQKPMPGSGSGGPPAQAGAGFDPQYPEKDSRFGFVLETLLRFHRPLLALLRALFRVFHFPFTKWYLVLGYDDVREILNRDREFPVPWSRNMMEVTDQRNFVLGMPRDDTYQRCYRQLAQVFTFEDIETYVRRASAELAEEIVERARTSNKPFDAVGDLITAVPARLCRTYYGLDIQQEALFARWTLVISSHIFGPFEDAERRRNAMAASDALRETITRSIHEAAGGRIRGPVMQRMLDLRASLAKTPGDPQLDDEAIRAHFYGMVLGFIPTDVLAGGNMLEVLLRFPAYLERARAAAIAGDDELLWKCLREALRFRHINPGPWRECAFDYTLGAGGNDPYRIPAGARVMALAQSAMFDARRVPRPDVFDPDRGEEDYFTFGIGQHWCIGAYIAKAQITATFKPLLLCEGLRAVHTQPWIRVKRYNDLFPLRLEVELK